jgi:ABC-type nitrate/sulfonate/bicarbonate transport system permease component
LWLHIWSSTWRVFLDFFIGSGLALVFAILVGLNKQAEEFLESSFSVLKSIPSLAWMFMIAAELIAATQGIGYLLSDGRETSRPNLVIIAIILWAILGKITDSLMKLAENWLLRWRDVVKKIKRF